MQVPNNPPAPVLSGSMNWDPVRKRLLSTDLNEALKAASELRQNIEIVHTTEFPLMLSALLPAFSSVLAHRTRPSPDTSSIEHKLRHTILDIVNKMPSNEVLRPHAPHLIAVAMDILSRDYEDNSLLASKIIFDLYKAYRSLPQDYVQPYLDFVVGAYRNLPAAIQRNFTFPTTLPAPLGLGTPGTASVSLSSQPHMPETDRMDVEKPDGTEEEEAKQPAPVPESSTSFSHSLSTAVLALRSNVSFRVLTESPLIVMLMLQLYPSFLKTNIPVLINVMMESLSIRPPSLESVATTTPQKLDSTIKRLYYSRSRELVAAQAKTLSFVTYLLRSFAADLKPYEDRLASSVVTLMKNCPRESISTRKELLVATRHVLNSEFRKGFFRHVDSLLDERILMGSHHRFSDQAMLRPLGYTTLSDLVQHARSMLSMSQVSKIVLIFSRVLHDSSMTLPLSTQYTAVRTLLTLVDLIYQNKDPNPQIGRDLLVRMLRTLVDKLAALVVYFPVVLEKEKERVGGEGLGMKVTRLAESRDHSLRETATALSGTPPDSVRDIQIMVRAIIVGNKTIITYMNGYRNLRDRTEQQKLLAPGTNDEVVSASGRLTNTECAIIDRYITTIFPAAKMLKEKGVACAPHVGRVPPEKSLPDQHRDALTYFAAAFSSFDGIYLTKTLGNRLDVLIDAIVDDPLVMVVPRHLLGANATTSFEFCTLLMGHLVERMDDLAIPRSGPNIFLDPPEARNSDHGTAIKSKVDYVVNGPSDRKERQKRTSVALLQLFERVLKSLSVFPENESIVRRHLRRIVVVCLRTSFENTEAWPDNYCMLLRYLFRSISAGKFEDSYKELLPLIPTVLNGVYRVISCSRDFVLQYAAVELCLTIPARLSTLLPHMNLLLRVIIPALDSQSGDLVNLGLRTLEFWVDNLNPLFLIPEISKHTELFTQLMQCLSRHLRPAPYPYGLLTLRLLGKLGGKNRQYLREPLLMCVSPEEKGTHALPLNTSWAVGQDCSVFVQGYSFSIPIPLDRCVEVLRQIASSISYGAEAHNDAEHKLLITWDENPRLWIERIDLIDFTGYQKDVLEQTKQKQANACATLLYAAARRCYEQNERLHHCHMKSILLGLMYASLVDSTKNESLDVLKSLVGHKLDKALRESLVEFLSENGLAARAVGLGLLQMLVDLSEDNESGSNSFTGEVLSDLCKGIASRDWGDRALLQEAVAFLLRAKGSDWSRQREMELMTTAFVAVKSVPLELSDASVSSLLFFVRVCLGLYGTPWKQDSSEKVTLFDALDAGSPERLVNGNTRRHVFSSETLSRPCIEVFRLALVEIAASQDIVRFASRFLLFNFVLVASTIKECTAVVSEESQMALVRKIFFSRSLRLLPLPQQVGVIEGLAILVQQLPGVLSLSDQHLLAFVSELLKMSSVADGEMVDPALKEVVVDKNGFSAAVVASSPSIRSASGVTHSTALFYRRMCIMDAGEAYVVVPEQHPTGVQLRVSTITLLHTILLSYSDSFFDAEPTTPIGNVRQHVISLLFRSLVSTPLKAVTAAHVALKDALSLSSGGNVENSSGESRVHKRLPKELLQACIRPVLLNLRDYTRLTIPLLRGLQRLLELLSSWFNRTLGEKLLDHLQKWLDPSKILSLKIWREGEEPLVASAIVDVFSLLPNSSQFVDPLVKTCIKLEACLSAYSARLPKSPYRRPLARYLDRHPHHSVSFFFPRLKSPVYSELFQSLLRLDECSSLRLYLCTKQGSVMILNYCFEKPLAIIRSEKSPSSGNFPTRSLHVHGIGPKVAGGVNEGDSDPPPPKPMTEESLELQFQGFRLVETLLLNNEEYFSDHNDIVRAFRWLWRSKGRFLRLQHEDAVSPRFQAESSMLATFLMQYGKSLPNDDFDILFELIRVFLQPSSTDFGFVSRFLRDTVSQRLSVPQKQQVMNRFFSLIAGESSEETKVLSIQYLVYPMVSSHFQRRLQSTECAEAHSLISQESVKRFVHEILFVDNAVTVCGDRLKVELLRLCGLMISYIPDCVEPFRNEVVKFSWSLLKSDDTSCKGWAYLVVCRCIAAFEIPERIVLQVYAGLLRLHQQEGRELVKEALDQLIPALPLKLNDEDFGSLVDQATKLMFEDSNSTPQLAHISQIIVRNPEVFYAHRSRFSGYLLSSLNRLGLPPNSPLDNRVLSLQIVELLLDWDGRNSQDEPKLFSVSQVDSVANFLVRLKLLIAESGDSRSSRPEPGALALDSRVIVVFERVLSSWNCNLREQPFEKVVSKDKENSGLLLSCLELLVVLTKLGRSDFFDRSPRVFKDLIAHCFKLARDDLRLKDELRTFVLEAGPTHPLSSAIVCALERALVDAAAEVERIGNQRSNESAIRQGRNRDRTLTSEATTEWSLFCLDVLCQLCDRHKALLSSVSSTLLALGSVLTKNHVFEATSKQRQQALPPRVTASGVKNHTPTVGIIHSALVLDPAEPSRPSHLKQRWHREETELTTSLRAILMILSAFESSDVLYTFSQNRKAMLQILGSILDSSDSVYVLLGALRIVCKLLSDETGSPLTKKEKSGFLVRLASMDSSNVLDDLAAQPLTDLIMEYVQRHLETTSTAFNDLLRDKLFVSSLMNAHRATRERSIRFYMQMQERGSCDPQNLVTNLLQADLEGLGGRFWIVVFVDALLQALSPDVGQEYLSALSDLAHGDIETTVRLFECLLPAWSSALSHDDSRLLLISHIETLLSRPYHTQFLKEDSFHAHPLHASNSLRTFLNTLTLFNPIPILDTHLLVYLAENYNSWHEVTLILSRQLVAFSESKVHLEQREETLAALRHCYQNLSERDLCLSLASMSSKLPLTSRAISFDMYGMIEEAADSYWRLMTSPSSDTVEATEFETEFWEDRWVHIQRELCQLEVVTEVANEFAAPTLGLECAWKAQEWTKVRSILNSPALLPAAERGDPVVKISETILAVVEGKLNEIENLHAQSAQLCLYKWQLLPRLSSGSPSHSSLLHFFHRLVEIRESGQIVVETSNHTAGRTIPDLKNLLNAWRHRLPNDWEPLSAWDEIFAWRGHMFNTITSSFSFCEPDVLATLHDRPWAAFRMAKTARKQGFRDVSLLLLNKAVEERTLNVSDAFFKLREQILMYYNLDSDTERHVGLNLINTTNLSFFDSAQKSELFRLKALFLSSLGGRSKANQAYCHSLQICQTHARAWESWGSLCSSLGAVAEKQLEQAPSSGDDASKDPKAIGKKVAQYLAQAMGCYLEAIQLNTSEWNRLHLSKVLWMLTKDGPAPGVLCQTLENRGPQLPGWVWLPWLPQLLSGLCRPEGRAAKAILSGLATSYTQAVYYSLRVFYLERRDVERSKGSPASGHQMNSLLYVEELVSLLRRSHASLWNALESVLEELLVKFRPLHEEELLSPMVALLERAESQLGTFRKEDEESVAASIWKTVWKIAAKFFRPSEQSSNRIDERSKKTALFKQKYRDDFEADFHVSSATGPGSPTAEGKAPLSLDDFVTRLRVWKRKLEKNAYPRSVSLIESSPTLAVFAVADVPDLWPGSCDPKHSFMDRHGSDKPTEKDNLTLQPSTSLSAASAALSAALSAAKAVTAAAAREGSGGDYGGGSSFIEIPGQYPPNTAQWADCRPSPELHPKLLRFEQTVHIIRRSDQLVRRIGMVGSDGKTYRFIVQAAVPFMTRTDERTAQTSRILDMLLRKSMRCARANLSVQPLSVTPMAQRLRLVSEPDGRLSLEDVYRQSCKRKRLDPSELATKFNDEVAKAVNAMDTLEVPKDELQKRERAVKLEVFNRISALAANESAEMLQQVQLGMGTAELVYQFRRTFCQQWAANCLLQYGFCVAERTPSRVVLVKSTGCSLSPEFRISYNSQGYLDVSTPVPFRLTSNLLNLIGFPLMSGHFVPSMANVAGSVREHRHDLLTVLRLLARDDLIAFYTRSMPKSDIKTQEMEKQLADRVLKNATTILSRIGECAPRFNQEQDETNPIDKRVRDLIEAACCTDNVCQMPSCYQGWL